MFQTYYNTHRSK